MNPVSSYWWQAPTIDWQPARKIKHLSGENRPSCPSQSGDVSSWVASWATIPRVVTRLRPLAFDS